MGRANEWGTHLAELVHPSEVVHSDGKSELGDRGVVLAGDGTILFDAEGRRDFHILVRVLLFADP